MTAYVTIVHQLACSNVVVNDYREGERRAFQGSPESCSGYAQALADQGMSMMPPAYCGPGDCLKMAWSTIAAAA